MRVKIFYGFESSNREIWFPHLREMYEVCVNGFLTWAGALENGHHWWPCAAENLYFIDATMVVLLEVRNLRECVSEW
jgi:hypothetical protein